MALEFLAAACTGGALLLLVLRFLPRQVATPAAARLQNLSEKPKAERQGLSWDEIRRRGPSTLPLIRDSIINSDWGRRTSNELEQAGLKLRVGEYLILRFAAGFLAFALIAVLTRSSIGVLVGFAMSGLVWVAPAFWLRSARHNRAKKVAQQLPEAVTMIANSLRAGFAFQHGIGMVADQMEPPVSEEFLRVQIDLNVGASVDEALNGLLTRADSEAMNQLVTAVLIQRSSGGNLAEILDIVAEQLRDRERMSGEIRVQTAQMRFSGVIMSIWPMLLLGMFSLLNWDQTSLLFTTGIGLILLAFGAMLQLLAFFTIRKLLDIKI